jgi:hypothetical protein
MHKSEAYFVLNSELVYVGVKAGIGCIVGSVDGEVG